MLLKLFKTFLKIGAFTFGGGYAMISIIKEECVEKNKWITNDEYMNLVAVAESTPGPISVNLATYVGHKMGKLPGAIISTLGVVIPSIVIIFIITLFVKDFLKIKIIQDAFFGIRIAVAIIIVRVAISLILDEIKRYRR